MRVVVQRVAHAAVEVDGKEIARMQTGLGDFELRGDVPAGKGERRMIQIEFNGPLLHLPGADNRPVGGMLKSLAFE